MGRKAGITINDVVNAAVDLANRDGLDSLTLAAVASDLGVRSPSLYNHVDGLEGLGRELTLRANQVLREILHSETDGREGADALRGIAHGYRRFAHEHPGLFACLVSGKDLRSDPEVWQAVLETMTPFAAAVESLGYAGDDNWEVMRLLRSSLYGFLTLELQQSFAYRHLDPSESYDRLVEVMLAGLRDVTFPGES